MYICPRCGHNRFIAPAVIMQDWMLDECGDFIKVTDECTDVYTYPNKADKWECAECGYADSPDSFESDECD